jgi:hypothetical protein
MNQTIVIARDYKSENKERGEREESERIEGKGRESAKVCH